MLCANVPRLGVSQTVIPKLQNHIINAALISQNTRYFPIPKFPNILVFRYNTIMKNNHDFNDLCFMKMFLDLVYPRLIPKLKTYIINPDYRNYQKFRLSVTTLSKIIMTSMLRANVPRLNISQTVIPKLQTSLFSPNSPV